MTKRPKLRTSENADRVCELLAQGQTLRQVAQRLGCDASAITYWVRDDQDAGGTFSQRYARARDAGYEHMADELVEISDADCAGPDGKPDNALVQQARLRVETRKWILSKMLPKRYGDRITAEIAGDPNSPLITRIELVPVDPIVRSARLEELPARDGGDEATMTPLRALPSR